MHAVQYRVDHSTGGMPFVSDRLLAVPESETTIKSDKSKKAGTTRLWLVGAASFRT